MRSAVADGDGEVPMEQKLGTRDLSSAGARKQPDGQVAEVVTKGKNKVPGYDGRLTEEQFGGLIAYI